MWRALCGDLLKLVQRESYLRTTDGTCANDCKSLADALLSAGAAASTASEDKRLAIEMSMIKQKLAQREVKSYSGNLLRSLQY